MFGSHIMNSAKAILCIQRRSTMSHYGNTKIAQNNLIIASQEHILRFNIPVDQFSIVRILQSCRNIFDIPNDSHERNYASVMMNLAKCTLWHVFHDEVGAIIAWVNAKVQNTNDIGVLELSDSLCLLQKVFQVLRGELSM